MSNKIRIDFIGIGAQKAGTTWLYERLKELPDFHLPPIKELHYFDRDPGYPSPNGLSNTQVIQRITNYHWLKRASKDVLRLLLHRKLSLAQWKFRWHFSNYSDQWYLSLFQSKKEYTGEITPAYAMLNVDDIKQMYRLAPNAKIIFILRNPIDRAWSQYCYHQRRHEPNSSINIDHAIEFIESANQERRTDYLNTINNYLKVYPKGQILLGFYDAIADKPYDLLHDIVNFIGGDTTSINEYCSLDEKSNVNISHKFSMPPEVDSLLKEKYKKLITQMASIYGGYCQYWYDQAYQKNSSMTNYHSTILIT